MRRFAIAWCSASIALSATAATCDPTGLFDRVGQVYGIDPVLLYAIALTESGARPNAIARNANGTVDHGAMQINSVHLPTLAGYGIRREDLMDPCTNVAVGAWVLSNCFARYGVNWQGVGCYNSATPRLRDAYARKVAYRYNRLRPGNTGSLAAGPQRAPASPHPFICAVAAGCLVERSAGGLLVSAFDPRTAQLLTR